MTTTAITYQRIQSPRFPVVPILILLLALILVGGLLMSLSAHATDKHLSDADWVRDCLNRNGTLQLWNILGTDKYYRVCTDLRGKFGIQAVIKEGENAWREITSFVKNKMHTLAKVEQYLRNAGATRIW